MNDFILFNPTRIVFGRDSFAQLSSLVPGSARILVTYGGGSIKRNGVYDRIARVLSGRNWQEFGGIEPNPDYATLMRAVELVRRERIDFLLAVGGGSTLDGTKFISAAACYEGDPWQILVDHGASIRRAIPMGTVLTLPATGSEANPTGVISRRETGEKYHFGAEPCFPVFSVLDPQTMDSLPPRQLANGLVDAYVHVVEQYLTYPSRAPLQDRQAEGILSTLIEVAPAVLADPPQYDARAALMWCATQALNGLIGAGVPQDWATHMIGHELTALYGLDHGVTLAIVLPGVLRDQLERKSAKLRQYGRRVFGVDDAFAAIERTEAFFRSVGVPTRLSEHAVDATDAALKVRRRFEARGTRLGEHGDLDASAASRILMMRK